jgi:hypothetical protein
MEKKYEITSESKTFRHPITDKDVIVYRIKALKEFSTSYKTVKIGDLGGWIEKESNLSHEGK